MICFQSAIGWSSGAEGAPHVHVQRLWVHPFPSKARHGHFTAENAVEKVENKVDNIKKRLTFLLCKSGWSDVFSKVFGTRDKPFWTCPFCVFLVWSGGARAPFLTRSSNAPCVVQAKFLGSFVCARGLCATKSPWLSSKQGPLAGGMMNDQMVSFRDRHACGEQQ